MVSTCSRARVSKKPEAEPRVPAANHLDLAAILEGQAEMQQDFADFKKHNTDKIKALRQENSGLRRKIEAYPT